MDTDSPRSPSPEALAALAWLEGLADDPIALDDMSPKLRARLQRAIGRVVPFDREERRALLQRKRRAHKARTRQHDDAVLDRTSNRALKRSLRFPVAPPSLTIDAESRRLLEVQAGEPIEPTPRLTDGAASAAPTPSRPKRLLQTKGCYVCKADFDRVHEHYDSMCPTCAAINWQKREQTADLSGRVSVVTGARVKIGYEAVLKLLRAGSHVVATTRFPSDAAKRYAREPDFAEWSDRLEVHGLDLRHTPSVEAFTKHLDQALPRLDFLIHNACQTVRRPPEYYTHLIERERFEDLSDGARALLQNHVEVVTAAGETDAQDSVAVRGPGRPQGGSVGITHAAELTQLDLLDEKDQAHLFPRGLRDGEGQQLDLRRMNSWRMELADVPTIELIEVQLVNSIAPFVMTARLKPLMLRVPSRDKHVVNVSAMEGQFNRFVKTTRHPHTNMAKAALNMMTRTSAADFVKSGIHMNSVDTGWVTDEDPFDKSVRKESEQRFIPPLDSIDGAARVLDPIFTGFLTGTHCWGKFLKDYAPTDW